MFIGLFKETLLSLVKLSTKLKMMLMVMVDAATVFFGCYLVIAAQNNSFFPYSALQAWFPLILLSVVLVPILLAMLGMYRQMVRFAEPTILYEVFKGVTLALLVIKLADHYVWIDLLSPQTILGFWSLWIVGILGSRLVAKWIIYNNAIRSTHYQESIAIFGAGEAGVSLLKALERNLDLRVVAFFDDNKKLTKRKIKKISIYHSSSLKEKVKELDIRQVIVAIPSISIKARQDLINKLEGLGIRVRLLPSVEEMIGGRVMLSHIRDVKAGDVLGREKHIPNEELINRDVAGKTVMVTGGGGSIGSELCKQILKHNPNKLVVFEASEFALYEVEQILQSLNKSLHTQIEVIAILGDVRKQEHLEGVIEHYNVDTIYHAAAYKHVPMVEKNVCEGVLNNVFGTLSAAQAAIHCKVGKFVLISTDKAVRPTNVMGASKRLAEMSLQALNKLNGASKVTTITMVRFGNVLDSAGSVVPLFRRQIRNGGPVTLTHKDVTRYFMTIPEAAQLVLQAAAMAEGGEVFLLDMGEPVRIYDLALRMIKLSGLTLRDENNANGDIEIEIMGLRPGEKLYEELFLTDDVKPTRHESILQAEENFLLWEKLEPQLKALKIAINNSDQDMVRSYLKELVEGFNTGPV